MIPFNARSDAVEFSQCERNSTNQAIEARRDSEPNGSEAEGLRGRIDLAFVSSYIVEPCVAEGSASSKQGIR